MADERARRIRDKIQNGFEGILQGEHEFVTRWVVLVETVDQKGKRGFWNLVPKDSMPWDALGLLLYAIHVEQATTVREENG